MDKQFQEGPVALEVVSSEGGVVALKVSVSQKLGGGKAAGILGAKLSGEIDVSASQALGLSGDLLKAHFPSLSGEIDALVVLGQSKIQSL